MDNDELMIEHLGFAPIQFIDKTINIVNETMYKCIAEFEKTIVDKLTEDELQAVSISDKGMQFLETLYERSIDSRFDRFEIYVLKNILSFPKGRHIVLDHYKPLLLTDFDDEDDEAKLDQQLDLTRTKILAQRYLRSKLHDQEKHLKVKLVEVAKANQSMSELDEVAKSHGCYPIQESIKILRESLLGLDNRMELITKCTDDVKWDKVPLIGSNSKNSSRLNYVEADISEYIKLNAATNAKSVDVSAWDIARDYKDAGAIGSISQLESVKKLLFVE